MPQKQKNWRVWSGPGGLMAAVLLAGTATLFSQTPIGRETVVVPSSTAGQGRGLAIGSEAGEPGKAGGQGTIEPNPVTDVETAYESMFRTFNNGVLRPIKVGSGTGRARVATPVGLNWGVPLLQWQFRPEDAEIKIGNFYLDFRTISGSLLFSDNATHSDPATKSGFISMIGWSFAAIFQVQERLRLAVGFPMVYLPFQNKFGFIDPMEMYSLNGGPRGLAQVSYDLPVGNWDLHFYDFFGVFTPGYMWGGHFDLFDTEYMAQDQIGRYSYRILDRNIPSNTYTYDRLLDYYGFRNSIGVHASKLLQTETRFSWGAARHDIWSSGLPNDTPKSGEMVYAALDNERENMRFKPHFHYTGTHSDGQDGFSHTVKAGVKGPVSDYIDFFGEVGYYWTDSSPREAMLWTLGLTHDLNATTSQRLYFLRTTTWPLEAIRTAVGYSLHKVLGPDLQAEFVAEYGEYDPIEMPGPTFQEYQTGVRAMYHMTGRMSVRSGIYYRLVDSGTTEYDSMAIRTEVGLKLTPTVDAMLMHLYQNLALTKGNNGWQENLVILTVRKTF